MIYMHSSFSLRCQKQVWYELDKIMFLPCLNIPFCSHPSLQLITRLFSLFSSSDISSLLRNMNPIFLSLQMLPYHWVCPAFSILFCIMFILDTSLGHQTKFWKQAVMIIRTKICKYIDCNIVISNRLITECIYYFSVDWMLELRTNLARIWRWKTLCVWDFCISTNLWLPCKYEFLTFGGTYSASSI